MSLNLHKGTFWIGLLHFYICIICGFVRIRVNLHSTLIIAGDNILCFVVINKANYLDTIDKMRSGSDRGVDFNQLLVVTLLKSNYDLINHKWRIITTCSIRIYINSLVSFYISSSKKEDMVGWMNKSDFPGHKYLY